MIALKEVHLDMFTVFNFKGVTQLVIRSFDSCFVEKALLVF